MNVQFDTNLLTIVANEIRTILGDDEDTQAFLDTLDGETDVMDVIGKIITDREEAKAFSAAAAELEKEYRARKSRLAARADADAKALGAILDAIGERKVAHPIGTVSRTNGRMAVDIEDESLIPTQLTKTTVAPDKAAIKAQLEAGETVPGARLSKGPDGLTVRVK